MTASIRKLAIAILPVLLCQAEVRAADKPTGQRQIDRGSAAVDVFSWQSFKPKDGENASSSTGGAGKQVAPIDDGQPVITPRQVGPAGDAQTVIDPKQRNKGLYPENSSGVLMNKEQVAPIDDNQPIFTPHPTKGSKQ
ncbi:hypothetical protein QMZ05_27395 [Bradyrhizobium sp. INPA03-11B]|uniref:hypothetical protein n=1 Tax=Bradyrhizobium sp. INPA03-11B TaxID=418598 RepID=UPI00338FC3FA